MKGTNFKFSNLCGTVFNKGNLVFTPDGNSLISPVGNRVSSFDLVTNNSFTFPVQTQFDISRIAIHPRSTFLLLGDIKGYYSLVNFHRRVELDSMYIPGGRPYAMRFSPQGTYFSIATQSSILIFKTPGREKEFNSFKKIASTPLGQITRISWDESETKIVCSTKNFAIKVFEFERDIVYELTGFKAKVHGAWWMKYDNAIIALSADGIVTIYENDDSKTVPWVLEKQVNLKFRPASCDFQKNTNLFVAGTNDGTFHLYFAPEMSLIHSLNISKHSISTCTINDSSDWIAFGCANLGQLLVWEWKSETRKKKKKKKKKMDMS